MEGITFQYYARTRGWRFDSPNVWITSEITLVRWNYFKIDNGWLLNLWENEL